MSVSDVERKKRRRISCSTEHIKHEIGVYPVVSLILEEIPGRRSAR